MANEHRDRKKKQRRARRKEDRQQREARRQAVADALQVMRDVEKLAKIPPPASWPGGSDPTLARPDLVKFDFATFATKHEPGRSKYRVFEQRFARGPLGRFPGFDHWAIEEFIYHGQPGDPWHPIDAYLDWAGEHYPPPAQEQLRLWKEARIGVFEIGAVHDDVVDLQEWDPVGRIPLGSPLQAITLNMGGVNAQRQARGRLLLTYLAPWVPGEGLFCGMGYGSTLDKSEADPLAVYLELRHAEAASTPWPWDRDRATTEEYRRRWRNREWYGWLGERLRFPFLALVATPPQGKLRLKEVTGLVPSNPEQARRFGIYFEVPTGAEVVVTGGTAVGPLDVTSSACAALAEYHAFRAWFGPPPGTVGQPTFTRVK
jgi:hypothetical protein